jgi:hypothetical protein
MNGKQNFIFFFGLLLIFTQWYLSGHLHTLWAGIFTGGAPGYSGGTKQVVPGLPGNQYYNLIPGFGGGIV